MLSLVPSAQIFSKQLNEQLLPGVRNLAFTTDYVCGSGKGRSATAVHCTGIDQATQDTHHHAIPKSLLVDEIVRIGKRALSAVGGKDDVRAIDEQGMRNEKT